MSPAWHAHVHICGQRFKASFKKNVKNSQRAVKDSASELEMKKSSASFNSGLQQSSKQHSMSARAILPRSHWAIHWPESFSPLAQDAATHLSEPRAYSIWPSYLWNHAGQVPGFDGQRAVRRTYRGLRKNSGSDPASLSFHLIHLQCLQWPWIASRLSDI